MHFFTFLALGSTLSLAAPIKRACADAKVNEAAAITSGADANTGLGSLLNGDLTQARLEVAQGLGGMSDTLATLTNSTDANTAKAATAMDAGVQRAQAGVDVIGKNILSGADPNSGNNPQGEVAAGLFAANTSITQLAGAKGVSSSTLTSLQSDLATAIKGGEGVLAAQNKTIADVLDKNGNPVSTGTTAAAASSSGSSSSTASGAGGILGGLLGGLGLKKDTSKRQASDPLAGLLGGGAGATGATSTGAASSDPLGGLLGGLTGGAGAGSAQGGLGGLLGGLTGSSTGTAAGASSSGGAGGLGGLLGGLGLKADK